MWTAYWFWFAAALGLGILEVLAPGFILLGFALAAAVLGGVFAIGGPFAAYLAASLPITLVAFAALSLIAWLGLRRIFGKPEKSVKVWHTDIND
ncbi:NfeD family protein [Litoreibacter roseus]|uniref:NfeD family protein n=1 Tax=Litoreibacter roseus TaxID=2601869 RepID=A0A6N6JEY5_9RHOB|nr:hypothetical protein [Litoreibacter roseus]GFE64911.1 hypothetical protein KIN_19850 [Litoreibacter roseus]